MGNPRFSKDLSKDEKFAEWKGIDALSIKAVLGKELVFYGEQDFSKAAINPHTQKAFTAIYHVFFVTDKKTGDKVKFFGSGNLHKMFEDVKNKVPFEDVVEFVEGGGKFHKGYYKFKKTRGPFKKPTQETPVSTQAPTPT